jgi:hypothetical protein
VSELPSPLNPYKGTDPEADEQVQQWAADDAARASEWGAPPPEIAKGLSPAFGSRTSRRAQLVARLKRRQRYPAPVRGGTGKQARTRRRSF